MPLVGPSEILTIADVTARSDVIAADLLAQAEHDPNTRVVLVTTSRRVGEETVTAVERRLQTLATAAVASAA